MSSNSKADRNAVITALDNLDAAYAKLAAMPLHLLTRSELRAVLRRLEETEKLSAAVQRRLLGVLITRGTPAEFGATSWAEVLARTLRISQGEAQRRIAEVMYTAA